MLFCALVTVAVVRDRRGSSGKEGGGVSNQNTTPMVANAVYAAPGSAHFANVVYKTSEPDRGVVPVAPEYGSLSVTRPVPASGALYQALDRNWLHDY